MAMSEHVPLDSSNLASVAYDPDSQEMEVKFLNGSHYTYSDVPVHHFENLKVHPSPGGYFHQEIRRAHAGRKVEPGDVDYNTVVTPMLGDLRRLRGK